MGQQFLDAAVGLRGQPLEHVAQVGVRVMPVELGRLHQAHRCRLGAIRLSRIRPPRRDERVELGVEEARGLFLNGQSLFQETFTAIPIVCTGQITGANLCRRPQLKHSPHFKA